jgi:hypothetical protein
MGVARPLLFLPAIQSAIKGRRQTSWVGESRVENREGTSSTFELTARFAPRATAAYLLTLVNRIDLIETMSAPPIHFPIERGRESIGRLLKIGRINETGFCLDEKAIVVCGRPQPFDSFRDIQLVIPESVLAGKS